MRRIRLGALALVAAGALAGGPLAAASTAITGRPGYKCPRGAFCIYPTGTTWKTGPETHGKYYSYGAHNLHHQYGMHLVYNNQYPVWGVHAGVSFCVKSNGRGGNVWGPMTEEHHAAIVNLTPINSITLWLFDTDYYNDIYCQL